jgi:hypothetical protein
MLIKLSTRDLDNHLDNITIVKNLILLHYFYDAVRYDHDFNENNEH